MITIMQCIIYQNKISITYVHEWDVFAYFETEHKSMTILSNSKFQHKKCEISYPIY